jgi:CheY-like chemotaxis protein
MTPRTSRSFEEDIMSALRKVLVVDDDPVVGASFSRVLSDKGYEVVSAGSGHEALVKMHDQAFDVVFTDIRMPGMSGLEVAERVRSRRPWTPVVIITGHGTAASEQRARDAGVSDFLYKPLSPDMIEQSALKAMHEAPGAAIAPQAPPQPAAEPAESVAAAPSGKPSLLKNMALFLAAPFVGLVYAMLLPFVGFGMLAWVVGQALYRKPRVREALRFGGFVGKLVAAPFIGLAWFVLAPPVGLAMLAWTAGKALVGRPAE